MKPTSRFQTSQPSEAHPHERLQKRDRTENPLGKVARIGRNAVHSAAGAESHPRVRSNGENLDFEVPPENSGGRIALGWGLTRLLATRRREHDRNSRLGIA